VRSSEFIYWLLLGDKCSQPSCVTVIWALLCSALFLLHASFATEFHSRSLRYSFCIFPFVVQCAKLNLVLAGKPVFQFMYSFYCSCFSCRLWVSYVIKGPQLPKKIRAIACYKDYTFAAYGSDIAVFKRTDQVRKLLCYHYLNFCYLSGISYISPLAVQTHSFLL